MTARIEVGSHPGELLYEAAAFSTPSKTRAADAAAATEDCSRLLALPSPLLQEAVCFVGDARSTARLLLRTSKRLTQAVQANPDLWAAVPFVRVRCHGQAESLAVPERTGQAIVRGPGRGLRALEVVGDRRPPITYAATMPVKALLRQLPRLRALTVAHALLDDGVLSALQTLQELESLDIGSCDIRVTNSCAPDWAKLFWRLRALTVRIPVAEQLKLGQRALTLRQGGGPGSSLRALRLTAANAPGSPHYVEALVSDLLTQWGGPHLEEVGCESRYASQTVVDVIAAGRLPALRVLELGHIDEDLVNDLLRALAGHAPALAALRLRLPGTRAIRAENELLCDLLRRAPLTEFDALDWQLAEEVDDEYSWRRSGSVSDTPAGVYLACLRSETLRSLRVPEAALDKLATRPEYVGAGAAASQEGSEGAEGEGGWAEGGGNGRQWTKVLEVPAQLRRLVVVKGAAPGEFANGHFFMYAGGGYFSDSDLDGSFPGYDSGSEDYGGSGGDDDGEGPRIFCAPHLEFCSLGSARDQYMGRLPNRLEFTALRELCLDLKTHKPYETLALSGDGGLEAGEKWRKVLAVQAPQLSTLTIVRASTLRALRIRSPTLRTLRLDDLSMLEALDVEAPLLDSLELEKAPQLNTLRLQSHALHDLNLGPCVADDRGAAPRPAAASASAAPAVSAAAAKAPPPQQQPPKGAGKKKRKRGSGRFDPRQAAARAAERARAAADLLLQPRAPLRAGVAHVHSAARLTSLAVCCPHLEALRIQGAAALRGTLDVVRRGPRGEEGLCCRLRSLTIRDCPGLTGVRLTGPGGVGKGPVTAAVVARARPPYVAPLREWALDGCPGVTEVTIDGEDVEAQAAAAAAGLGTGSGSGGWVVAGAARRALDFFALQHRGVRVVMGGKALPVAGANAAAGAQGPPATLPWVRR